MQDAQLISQAGLVESLASDGLVSVSTGAGQPQKNMELSKFAESLSSSVPLQQTSEQVSITGLYARTSDGKMVELTKESVASVMGNLLYGADTLAELSSGVAGMMNIIGNSFYTSIVSGSESMGNPKAIAEEVLNALPAKDISFSVIHQYSGLRVVSGYIYGGKQYGVLSIKEFGGSEITFFISGGVFQQRIDNFGYNTLAELSSGVAEQMMTNSLFAFNNLGNLKDSNLEDVGNGFGYAFSTNDGSDINGIFLSVEVEGYKFQLKADTSISGRIKYRMYHYSNSTWSDWVSLT